MSPAKSTWLLAALLTFGPAALPPHALAQDTTALGVDLQQTLRLLEESQAQEERLLEALTTQLARPERDWLQFSTLIASFLIAIGGWIFAAVQARKAHQAAQRLQEAALEDARLAQMQEHLFASLDFFSGRTQRRSIGIAVVKANWDRFPHLRPTWVSILVSQAIYLLTESGSHHKRHELQNLKDIVALLRRSDASVSAEDRVDLKKAFEFNRTYQKDETRDGLKIVAESDLDEWESAFR